MTDLAANTAHGADGPPGPVSLHDFLQRRRLTSGEAQQLGAQVARQLAALHLADRAGVGLLPERIWLHAGRVALTPANAAEAVPLRTLPEGASRGSSSRAEHAPTATRCTSPEELRGHAADAASDLFALGCVLFELFEQRPAFAGAQGAEVAAQILHATPPQASAAPPRIAALIASCLERDPARRPASAQAVAEALEGAASPSSQLGQTPNSGPGTAAAAEEVSGLPERYRFVSPLASGGMGRVSVVRDEVLRREVAVKEVLGTASDAAVARFEREALLTARLQHPGIVSVYEFARRTSGAPYLVLKRVRGAPLDEVVAQAGTFEKRLALLPAFASVVETVAYAHAEHVIHRDLKPANVLFGEYGETVVIDWGLAKDLREAEPEVPLADEPADGQLTRAGAVLGTPAYMSPQQARGDAIDERADVYALGAMLYQLLSGTAPYSGASAREVLDAVSAGPPPQLQKTLPALAPELSTIVARAMARELPDRYPSAKALSEDLKSFQAGRLVGAHSYSARELAFRWLRRNAVAAGLTAAFLVALAVGGTIAVRRVIAEKVTAQAERDKAARQAKVAQRISDFLTGLFRGAAPTMAQGKTITAREVVERGVKQIDSLGDEPEVQAQLLLTLGRVFADLDQLTEALALIERSVALREKTLGADHLDTIEAMKWEGNVLIRLGRFDDSAAMRTKVVEAYRRKLGPENKLTLSATDNLISGIYFKGDAATALKMQTEIAETARRVLPEEDRDRLRILTNLAVYNENTAHNQKAMELAREVRAIKLRVDGPGSPSTIILTQLLASNLTQLNRWAEAEPMFREVLAARVRVQGPDHQDTQLARYQLGSMLSDAGKNAEAEPVLREAIARLSAKQPEHAWLLEWRTALVRAVGMQGRTAEAARMRDELIAEAEKTRQGKDDKKAWMYWMLGYDADKRGDRETAAGFFDRALENGVDVSRMVDREPLADLAKVPRYAAFVAEVHRRAAAGK